MLILIMKRLIFLLSLSLMLAGCVTAPEPLTKKNSELTQGMVQMNLEVGKTTKFQVIEAFFFVTILNIILKNIYAII